MSLFSTYWLSWAIAVVAYVVGFIAAAHAVMYKRDPRSSAIWVLMNITLPIIGPWLYWVFGINRVQRRAARRFGRRGRPFPGTSIAEHKAAAEAEEQAIGHLHVLRNVVDRVARLPLVPGNSIKPLEHGEQVYPRMIAAIEQAQRSVTLVSYIFDWDEVGRDFVRVLGNAARRGVKVHTMVDGVGALGNISRVYRELKKHGAEVSDFFPVKFSFRRIRVNLRNHRKIMVVDGKLGFTGGMNISARHLMTRIKPGRSKDIHFEIEGPVVAEMQHTFVEDWALATKQVLDGDAYFPPLAAHASALCRGIPGGPDETAEVIHWILLAACAAARHSIRLVTPYFIPTSALLSAMTVAALRGVQITLILPDKVDMPFMRWAADAYLWQLLERGIKVYRHPAPFLHAKMTIVDERWVFLGSANLDPRSFRLNFEFNVEAYDVNLAKTMCAWHDELIANSAEVTLHELDSRPRWQRLRDGFVKMFSPHL